jgi:hypothetical protein
MSYLAAARQVLAHPQKVKRFPNWLKKEYYSYAIRYNTPNVGFEWEGMDVMEQDWDNLLILDAARYDMISEITSLDPKPITSKGSDSWGFIKRNFADRQLHDTVCISSNPHIYWLDDDVFHDTYDVISTHWDRDSGTVLPTDMVSVIQKAQQEYPNKRLLAHFMQPHYPFLGPSGEEIDMRMSYSGIMSESDESNKTRETPAGVNPWYSEILMTGTDKKQLIEAFRENHKIVWETVDTLLDELNGLSVVTSDHTNLIGERLGPLPMPGYGHPRGYYHPDLVTVPWAEVNRSDSRREITANSPVDQSEVDFETVQDRLKSLGYT